jgi:hypothetical protein
MIKGLTLYTGMGDCLSNFFNSTALIPSAYLDNQINYKLKIKTR